MRKETCKRSSCVGSDCEGCDNYKDNTKQTIKERVDGIFDEYIEFDTEKEQNVIVVKYIEQFKQELHEAFTNHFIELVDEERKLVKMNGSSDMAILMLNDLKSKLIGGKNV